jgi:hypothetical protein
MSSPPVTARESDASRSMINLPNIMTVFRILCAPVCINRLIDGRFGCALVWGAWGGEVAEPTVFVVASVTVGSGLRYLWGGTRMLRMEPAWR